MLYLLGDWLNPLPTKLRFVQLSIQPARRDQLIMGAAFHDSSAIHYQDEISCQDRGQAMGDDDICPACHDAFQRILN